MIELIKDKTKYFIRKGILRTHAVVDDLTKKDLESLYKKIQKVLVCINSKKDVYKIEKCVDCKTVLLDAYKRELVEKVEKIKEEIPHVAFGNEELKNKPLAEDTAICPKCNKKHKIKYGIDKKTGEVTTMVGFVTCGENSYMVSLAGKLIN